MIPLTERQRVIVAYIANYVKTHLNWPSLREVGAKFGIGSTNGVIDHYERLAAKGYIQRRAKPGYNNSFTFTPEARVELGLVFKGAKDGCTEDSRRLTITE